jgi:hypothetical protein
MWLHVTERRESYLSLFLSFCGCYVQNLAELWTLRTVLLSLSWKSSGYAAVAMNSGNFFALLGAFAKLYTATTSFGQSVFSHGTARLPRGRFSWNLTFEYSSKICRENSNSLKYDKNNGYFKWRPKYIYGNTRWILLNMRNVSDEVVQKIKIHASFSNLIFFENRFVYETVWNNTVDLDRPPVIIRCMQIACWTNKARNTPSEFLICIAFPLQQWLHEGVSLLHLYANCFFLWYYTLNKTNMFADWKLLCSFKFCNNMTSCICIARHHLVVLHWLANSAQTKHICVCDSLTGGRTQYLTYLLEGAFYSGRRYKPHYC